MRINYKLVLLPFMIVIYIFLWAQPAAATRYFSMVQTTSPAEFVMGTAQAITSRVTNTSTAGERITTVRFVLASTTYTVLPNPETFVAPTGWTCARSSNTTVTCTASGAAYYITSGTYKDFTFSINSAAQSYDRTDALGTNTRARFSGSNTWRTPTYRYSSWTWKSLLMTLTASPTSVGNGGPFTLTMNVTNKTNVALTNITSLTTKPPTPSYTGLGTNATTASVPANLNLNAGVASSMVWNYTLSGPANGTVKFSACAGTGANCTTVSGTSRTSPVITSGTVTIVPGLSVTLGSALTTTPDCLFSGGTATFVMTVSNTGLATATNIIPSALTPTPASLFGPFSGPTPTMIPSIAPGGYGTFSWSSTITGTVNDTYQVSGYATADGPVSTPTVSTAQDIDGYTVSVGTTNADSTEAELTWTVTNSACSNVNQVGITMPDTVNWIYGNDGYALVNNMAGNEDDSWAWLYSGGTTTFTAAAAADRIPPPPATPPLNQGTYSLLFSQTPVSPGTYTFIVTIIDDAVPPVSRVKQTTVTVDPFDATGPNATGTAIWHEDIK